MGIHKMCKEGGHVTELSHGPDLDVQASACDPVVHRFRASMLVPTRKTLFFLSFFGDYQR